MRTRKWLLSLLIAAGATLPLAASPAKADVSVGIAFGETAQTYPAAHRGGWVWDGYRYSRDEGRHYGYRRPGYVWVPGHWEGRGRHRHYVEGYWTRDRGYQRSYDRYNRYDGHYGYNGYGRSW